MTTPSLDALLKIASEVERLGPYTEAKATFTAAFNPTVAEALVRVAQATQRYLLDEDASEREVVLNLEQSFAALTAALKGSNHG